MSSTHSSRQEDSNELVALPGVRLSDEEAQFRGDHGSSIQATGQQQNDSDEQDPSNDMSPEEARLWADLKAETGYATYSDFLEACKEKCPYSKDVLEELHKSAFYYRRPEFPTCAIFDLCKGDYSGSELNLHCSSSSSSVILAALHQPAATAAIRIVLWNTSMVERRTVDALGLSLKIHPRFVHILSARGKVLPYGIDKRPLVPDLVVLGGYVVAMARCYLPVYSDGTPVVLIAGDRFGALSSKTQIDEMLRFQSATVENLSEPVDKSPAWAKEYVRILQYDLQKGRGSIGNDMDPSFRPLAPLFYFNTFRIREECSVIREKYNDSIVFRKGFARKTALEDLYEMRVGLRRMIEDSEDDSEQLQRFMRSQQVLDGRQEKSSTTIEDDLKQARLEAHRLETEIRDYLQLQTGELALQESRKSIELSNLQIEEGKRVKIFTILAFVYVPLNLATSIFGMNLEQLNGSGQHLWVFIITAVITLAVTGCSWLVIEQVNSYLKWRKRSPDEPYDGNTQFTLAVRLALIIQLVSNGHTSWMFKSGAWWRILTNHSSRLTSTYDSRKDQGRLNAGEYVSKYVSKYGRASWGFDDDIDYFRPFHLEGVQWISARE